MRDLTLNLATEDDTAAFASALAKLAKAGDCFLLRGPIGAGKSFFARAFIRARLGSAIDVPSPTFTLVQTYLDQDVEIWHADLYRLGETHEAIELGLFDALEASILLIEWPEILGDLIPSDALGIDLSSGPNGHAAKISMTATWVDRLRDIMHVAR